VDLALILAFVALGALVGFLAGLFGIGGGMTMVPLLTIAFSSREFAAEHVVHLAVATATATIMFTAISSTWAHHLHGAVLWPVVGAMAPGIIAGSLIGTQIVGKMSTALLAGFFGVFVTVAATNILLDRKPASTRELPGRAGLFAAGVGISLFASMVGAGGAFLTVPFLIACNVPLRNGLATSAALGLPVGIAGTVGYAIAGWKAPGLPPWSLGYIYMPALLAIIVGSVASAPAGARAAHRWPVHRLRRAYSILLYALAAYMLWKAWSSAHA